MQRETKAASPLIRVAPRAGPRSQLTLQQMPSNAIKRLEEAATGSAETRVCSRLLPKPFSQKELCGEATDVGGDVFFVFHRQEEN